ncbi:MAG: hypothetical protein JWO36_3070 [Myxococcales bacterium]|nr:hypothetical protein [Myxococcales bacterium]
MVTYPTPEAESGPPGLMALILSASFDYLIVYEPVP